MTDEQVGKVTDSMMDWIAGEGEDDFGSDPIWRTSPGKHEDDYWIDVYLLLDKAGDWELFYRDSPTRLEGDWGISEIHPSHNEDDLEIVARSLLEQAEEDRQ